MGSSISFSEKNVGFEFCADKKNKKNKKTKQTYTINMDTLQKMSNERKATVSHWQRLLPGTEG